MRKFVVLVGTMLVAVAVLSGVALASGPFAVTKTVPNAGATDIASTANVRAYFNHDVRASTVTSSTFKIRKQGTTTWLGATRSVNNTISPTSTNGNSQSVATLNPSADLASGTTYQVVVVSGSSGTKDVNGAALGANKSWTFTTVAPPNTTIDSGPTGVVASTSASFTFSSSKLDSSFQCSLDNSAFAGCASPKSYSGLSQGLHNFQVRAIDASGITDLTAASRDWTVDTVAPDTSITARPTNPSNNASPSFSFSSDEADSTFECKLDGDSFGACTSPKSLSSLSDGSHTFSVRATDGAGNTDATEATYTWTVQTIVDNVAPTVISVSPAHRTAGVAPSTNVTATFSEDMNPSSISGQTFKLFVAGSPVSAQVTYDQASRTATLNPAQDLVAGARYDAKIIKDVHLNEQNVHIDGVKDLAENTINEDKTWYFVVEAPPGVVTAAPNPLHLSPTNPLFCPPRQEYLTLTNRTFAPVTFADVSITGPDDTYFSSNSQGYLANVGRFTVLSGDHVFDVVTFSPGSTPNDRNRDYEATLTYKDATGATIGSPVSLTASVRCLVLP